MKKSTRAILSAAVAVGLVLSGSAALASQPHGAGHGHKHLSDKEQVLQLDQKVGDLVVAGDTKAVDKILSPDFQMTHGDQWTYGEKPSLVDTKATFLPRVTSKAYLCIQFDDIQVEMHGDVAITYGRYLASQRANVGTPNAYFSVWFERVYEKKGNHWIYLSHRTVKGPHFGATVAQALQDMGPADPNLTCP